MTTLKVQIKNEYIKELKSSEDLIISIQLARIVNSLRSNLRSYLNVSNDDLVIDAKDRIDLLLIHGSMLYEAIHYFPKFYSRIQKLKLSESISEDVKILTKEKGDNKSFTNTELNRIRNKMFFHFDEDIISEGIKNINIDDSLIFAIGKSTKRQDVVYSLVDDLILTDIVNISNEKKEPSIKYDDVKNNIIRLSDKLCNVFDNVIREILKGKLDFIKEKT